MRSEGKKTLYKRIALVILVLMFVASYCGAVASEISYDREAVKVLFIGNSKTFKQDIPEKVRRIAVANGEKIHVSSVTEPGKSLLVLSDNEQIPGKTCDVAVLQEQTQQSQSLDGFLEGAEKVTGLVREKNPDAELVLRKTWVQADSNEEEKKIAYDNTELVADDIGAVLTEEGPAFDACEETYPTLELYEDQNHPTEAGAYLAACCIYAAIFDQSPVGTSYTANLSEEEAENLQQIAAEAMNY